MKVALRIHAQHPQVPILFVFGWVDEAVNQDKLAGLRWGSLQKPYTPETLLPAVERLLVRGEAAKA